MQYDGSEKTWYFLRKPHKIKRNSGLFFKHMSVYKDIFENSPIPRLITKAEDNGFFSFEAANYQASLYFERPIDQLVDKNPLDIFDGDLGEYIHQALKSCVRTKKTTTVQSIADLVGDPNIQAFIFNPLLDENGDVTRVDMIARVNLPHNIQLRKERDDAVSMLTSIFDTSTVGILVLDRQNRIVRVNDVFTENFGWQRNDIIGEVFSEMLSEEDYEKFCDNEDSRDHKADQVLEMKIIKPNGFKIDTFVTTAFLELTSKRRFKIVTLLDVSRQKEMEYHLREAKDDAETANRAKSAFLANMSHELRTPLNAIIGFTELIKNGTFGPIANPKYEEYLTDILFSAQHLLDIINDVLDMSKIEAGKVEVHDREVDVKDLYSSVERIMHDRVNHAQLELVINIQPDLPMILADRRWLRQMLMNLVSNSVKFSPPNSKIIMEAELTKDGGMRMSVLDFGQGIPEDKIETVLEPFGQAGDSKTNMGQGTGLGLPLAVAMAEMHGGKLELKSVLDKGTSVHITLPPERVLADGRICDNEGSAMVDSPTKLTRNLEGRSKPASKSDKK